MRDGGTLTVRTATADDAPATLALLRSVVGEGSYTLREASELTTTKDEERDHIEEDRAAPGALCLVAAEEDGTVVGTVRASAGTYRRTRHFADIGSLWVDAIRRRQGVARGLLSALISWVRDHPEIEKLGLFVFSTNEAAIHMCQEHGFVVEGRYPRDIKLEDGTYPDTVAMGLLVKPPTA